jgi:hypothetical protein
MDRSAYDIGVAIQAVQRKSVQAPPAPPIGAMPWHGRFPSVVLVTKIATSFDIA